VQEEDVFVPFRELRDHGIPYCRLHVNRLVERKIFPEPVWLSPNRKVWRLNDIRRYKATRPTSRPTFPFGAADDAAD
jgi:hypothetical protein